MIEVNSLASWLWDLQGSTHEGHVDSLFGASVTTNRVEDNLHEQSISRVGLTVMGVNVAIFQICWASWNLGRVRVVLASWDYSSEINLSIVFNPDLAYRRCRDRLTHSIYTRSSLHPRQYHRSQRDQRYSQRQSDTRQGGARKSCCRGYRSLRPSEGGIMNKRKYTASHTLQSVSFQHPHS